MEKTKECKYIYSIGHGSLKFEQFSKNLLINDILYVVDVRTKPRSRFHPQFNSENLKELLKSNGIGYLYLGDSLGGLPQDRSCYDDDGYVLYEKIKEKSFYKEGINRLLNAHSKKIKIACMCSEIDACDCHRSKLIGETLMLHEISMTHINKNGGIEDQKTIVNRILSNNSMDIFNSENNSFKSRKTYKKT